MYICLNCREVFSEPSYWEERHGFDYGPFEQWSGCPYCGEGYVKAKKCECCGEYIVGTYIQIDSGERFCKDCYCTMDLGDED